MEPNEPIKQFSWLIKIEARFSLFEQSSWADELSRDYEQAESNEPVAFSTSLAKRG